VGALKSQTRSPEMGAICGPIVTELLIQFGTDLTNFVNQGICGKLMFFFGHV
jgi:hypothetical protein